MTKAKGQQRITVPTPDVDYPGSSPSTTLDDALSAWGLVVAEPIRSVAATERGTTIITWYKFKILETLSEPRGGTRPAEYGDTLLPAGLSPINSDEFVTSRCGRSVILDGITVEEEPDYARLR